MSFGDLPIIIDKSTLHVLSDDDVMELTYYYRVTQTPTMLMEILADIKKIGGRIPAAEAVRRLARKAGLLHGFFPPNARALVQGELTGSVIPMNGVPPVLHAVRHNDPDGGPGIYLDEQPEFRSLRNWERGDFTSDEQRLAGEWRSITHALGIEDWKRRQNKFPSLRDLSSLKHAIDEMIASGTEAQEMALRLLMDDLQFQAVEQRFMGTQWAQAGRPDLRRYAPYSIHCITVFHTFYFGVANDLFGTRDTNRVDLDYLLYFPFTHCFSSGDDFHLQIAPLFMNPDFIIPASRLKDDLIKLRDQRLGRTPEQEVAHQRTFGNRPAGGPDSVTTRLIERVFGPPRPRPPVRPSNPDHEREKVRRLNDLIQRANEEMQRQRDVTGDPKTELPLPPVKPP